MAKISLHCQGYEQWVLEYLGLAGCGWIKFVNAFPVLGGVQIIGRVHMDEAEQDAYIARGAAGAVDYYARVRGEMDKARHVAIWEGPNEPSIWTSDVLAGFIDFTQQLIALYHGDGFLIMAGQFNTGWPYLPTDDGGTQSAICGQAVQGADGVGFHEYDPADLRAEPRYRALRYQKTTAYWESLGLQVPPVFITELGLDRTPGTGSFGHDGWKTILGGDLNAYIEQLCWYEAQIQTDPRVQAATVFSVITNWDDFALDQGQCMALAEALREVEPPPPPPTERARGIDVSQWQGDINWQAVSESGVEFVMMRATVGLRVDPEFAANWDGAGGAGLLRGVYHYLEPDSDGQAAHFVNTVGEREPELGYWGDLEASDLTADKCQRFLEAVDRNLEYKTLCDVYTRASFFDKFGAPDWTDLRKLWVAHWDADEPTLPVAWSEWEFWQQSSDGEVPGIVGRVDLDVYNGTGLALHNEYGNGGEQMPDIDIKVFDVAGVERDWGWVVEQYGPLDVREAESIEVDGQMQKVALVEVREQYGPANCNVHLLDINGAPVKGIMAAWWYSTAPELPSIPPPTSVWEPRADYGPTNDEGVVGFAMSEDGYYWPDRGEIGPYGTWILAPGHPSDGLFGLGMVAATDHRHLNVWFRVVAVGEEPEPPEPPGDDPLERIAVALEKIASVFA